MPALLRQIFLTWTCLLAVGCGGAGDAVPPAVEDAHADTATTFDSIDTFVDSMAVQTVDAAPADAASADAAVVDPADASAAPDAAAPDALLPPTTLWVHYPKAAEIALRGDTPPLSWVKDLPPSAVENAIAKFILPQAKQIVLKTTLKGAWAIGNNQIVLDHEQRHLYPYFDPASAAATRENYDLNGPEPGKSRTLRAWLPPGYQENTLAHYPLLFMLDGQNVFDDQTASFGVSWKLGDAVLQAMAAAKLGEIVVIAVDHAGPKRIFEYTPWPDASIKDGGGGEAFLVWVDNTALPDAKMRYRLLDDRTQRAIGGSSLGGLMAMYALASRPQTWGNAICMSGSWWWDNLHMQKWLPSVWQTLLPVRIWLDVGTDKDGLDDALTLRDTLLKLGMKDPQTLGFYKAEGAAHSEAWWAKRVHLALEYLFDSGNLKTPF